MTRQSVAAINIPDALVLNGGCHSFKISQSFWFRTIWESNLTLKVLALRMLQMYILSFFKMLYQWVIPKLN